MLSTEHLGSVCSKGPFDNTSPKFRISSMGTAYGLGEEYGISTPENLVKGLAYVRTANPLKGFCKCTDKSSLFECQVDRSIEYTVCCMGRTVVLNLNLVDV